MKRFVILVILLYIFPLFCPGQDKIWHDRDQVREQSIHKLIGYEESFDVVELSYKEQLHAAEESGDEPLQSECLFQLARIYYWQTKFSLSLSTTQKGLAIARHLDDSDLLAVGYDLLARLHHLFSPEQAQYYYRKCWKYCEQSDSLDYIVANLNSYNLIRNDYEAALEDMLSIDIERLRPIHRARLSYLIARSMIANGRIDEALEYLAYTREYLQEQGASPLDAFYEQRMAEISLYRGETKQAWMHWNNSLAIVQKNKLLMEMVENYKLGSEIAQVEGNDDLALHLLQKSISTRDSIFNSAANKYFPNNLIYIMMEYMAEDEAQTNVKQRAMLGVSLILVSLIAFSLLYYFKSTFYRKKSDGALSVIGSQVVDELDSRLKNHLIKIMYIYKAGVNYCMKHTLEAANQPDKMEVVDYFSLLEKHMHKADELIDTLFDWVESQSGMQPQYVDFNATEIIEQIVDLYKVSFVSKHLSYEAIFGEKSLIVFGDKVMFIISIEHLFFELTRNAAENAVIYILAGKDKDGNFIFSVSDPKNTKHTLEKEIFARHAENIGKTKNASQTADWDFNVFAECSARNYIKSWIEINAETGTKYCFKMLESKPTPGTNSQGHQTEDLFSHYNQDKINFQTLRN